MTGSPPVSLPAQFVGPDVPALPDLQNCIHCGFCLPVCPTYIATGQELESPRGRLHLIRAALDGRAEATDRLLGHLDLCLQCRACETACPSNVPFGRIMEDARASTVARGVRERPLAWSAQVLVLRHVIARPRVVRAAFALLRMHSASVQRILRGPLRRFVPRVIRELDARAPIVNRRPFRRSGALATPSQPRGRVALLTGCVHGEMYPQTHEATIRVLARLGFEVVAPPDQGCCGALHSHAGDAEAARSLARRNIDAFAEAGIDAVIVNAAGCGAAMKEYGRLLRDDAEWAERAEQFGASVQDVIEFVAAQDFEPGLGAVDRDVTLQDACHLAHAQGIREAPRAILGAIPGLRLHEMAAPDRCCGSAGFYSVAHPEMSGTVLAEKMVDVESTGADVIATCNPGCTLQLELGVRRSDVLAGETDVQHVIELLDASYRSGDAAR